VATDVRADPRGEPPAPAPAEPLGTVARRALGWSMLNNVVGRVGTTLMGVVLARILAPEDYGVYAVALVALNALLSMNELGVSLAIVRWPGDVTRIAPTVTTLAVGFSVVLWIATFLAAPLLASELNAPAATGVIRLLTLSILIDALTAVPAALMTREFMQRERLIVDSAGFVVASSTAVILAVAGQGAWSLVWSALLGNVVNGLFILRYAPRRFRPGFSPPIARELLRFGLPLALASLLVFALLNVDYVIVGAELGPLALGFYLLAFNLSAWPVNMFSAPARRISLPLFARLHAGRTSASDAFAPACAALLLVTLPACLMLAVFADPLIRFAYGDVWRAAAGALPWLMVLAVTRVLGELAYDFLVALGRSGSNLGVQAVWLAALVPALLIGVRAGGIEGVAIGHAVVSAVVVIPAYAIVLRRAGVSPRAIAARLSRPLAGGLLAAAAGVAVLTLVPGRFAQLAVGGALVALVYVAVVYPMRALMRAPAARPA
jgi:O-antigen/teichoic acid export membrane protein